MVVGCVADGVGSGRNAIAMTCVMSDAVPACALNHLENANTLPWLAVDVLCKCLVAQTSLVPDGRVVVKACAMKPGVQTQAQIIASLAERRGLKNKHAERFVDALFGVACTEVENPRDFELACNAEAHAYVHTTWVESSTPLGRRLDLEQYWLVDGDPTRNLKLKKNAASTAKKGINSYTNEFAVSRSI